MIDSTVKPTSKTVVQLCPMMSQKVSWEIRTPDGKSERKFLLVRQDCIRGDCALWSVTNQVCALKGGVR